jgi:predicted transcriptional regulator
MPTKKPRVSVLLNEREASELQLIADQSHVSCSWVARQAIIEFLNRHETEQGSLPLVVGKGAPDHAA